MKTKLHLAFRVWHLAPCLVLLSTLNFQLSTAFAQGTAFTYEGQLQNSGSPAHGTYNLAFSLFATSSGGSAVAGPATIHGVSITNGLFTVTLDFGSVVWNGATNWLQIGVETNGAGSFTILAPRQQMMPTPYAIYAESAGTLSGTFPASQLTSIGDTNGGIGNFFVGPSGNSMMSGYYNTANGLQALSSNTIGDFNTANGVVALYSNTSGSDNTANGADALSSNTSGSQNTANGMEALSANVNGSENTANGFQSLYVNTSGNNDTANGAGALFSNSNGSDNTANGFEALYDNLSGANNTANGSQASFYNTSGGDNTASGAQALFNNTGGSYNTAEGFQALYNNTGGSGNIAIGVDAGIAIGTGNNNIDIGNAGYNDESDTIRIGTSQTKAVMLGIYGTTIATGGTPVYVNPSGLLGTATSSARFKQNIHSMADASDVLLALRPVTFEYKADIDPNGTPQFGLVAEEVEKVDPALVVHDDKHQIYSVRYEAVNAMLLNEFLKQHRTVETQRAAINNQQMEIDELKDHLSALEKIIRNQKSN